MAETDMSSRDAIFAAIRQGLGRGALSPDAQRELQARVTAHKANLIPARAKPGSEAGETAQAFIDRAEKAACSIKILADTAALPEAVADYLRDNNLGGDIAMAPGDFLEALPWEKAPMVNCRPGTTEPSDLVSLTPALAGVAETGTLVMASGVMAAGVMASGADNAENQLIAHPTGLNFTPDHHLVALKTSQLRAGYEEVWELLRKSGRPGRKVEMPRSLNMITGPSRTGDIGLQIHLGAHGPRRLHILLIDDAGVLQAGGSGSSADGDGKDGEEKA
jgi:L-lactate dehydrogenase complex protein LldG